eukprot:626898-Prymnesium_polylepis.1
MRRPTHKGGGECAVDAIVEEVRWRHLEECGEVAAAKRVVLFVDECEPQPRSARLSHFLRKYLAFRPEVGVLVEVCRRGTHEQ